MHALPALVMPLIISVGILSGAFTATEAGVVAVAYGIVYGFATRQLSFETLRRETLAAAITSSSIQVILGGAALVSWLMSREGVPAELAALVKQWVSSKEVLLLMLLAHAIVTFVPVLSTGLVRMMGMGG